MPDDDVPWQLLERYCSGRVTPEDLEQLESWRAGDPRRRILVERLRALFVRQTPRPTEADIERAWERLADELPERQACRVMVGLLDLAMRGGCEAALAQRLTQILDAGLLPELPLLEAEFAPRAPMCAEVSVHLPHLGNFDALLSSEVSA